jgi:hypothetical protein
MPKAKWLQSTSPAFRLAIATSWLAPDSWQQHQEEAIRVAVAAGPDWTEYVHLVDRHQTPALSWAALSRVPGIVIPPPAGEQLRKLSDTCRIQAMQQCLLLMDVLKRFNRAGIPAMPLKGQILSFELYGDVGFRQSSDLDLEVAQADLGRAQACLESIDWHPNSAPVSMTPRQWDSSLQNELHISFTHSRAGQSLELHWRNLWETPDATERRWARSSNLIWQGCSIHTMSPCDLTLYLCNHGGKHAWCCAKWIGDLGRAHSLGLLDWHAALDEVSRWGQERVLLVGLRLLDEAYGLPLPDLPEGTWIGQPSRLVQMPLQALKNPLELPTDRLSFGNSIRMARYERLLRPRRTWAEILFGRLQCRENFKVLPLPDRLFWFYKPLGPFLWLWRWARQSWRESPKQRLSPPSTTQRLDHGSAR